MKSCVVTANYACDPNKVWLYLTKPTPNGWRRDVSSYEESDDAREALERAPGDAPPDAGGVRPLVYSPVGAAHVRPAAFP